MIKSILLKDLDVSLFEAIRKVAWRSELVSTNKDKDQVLLPNSPYHDGIREGIRRYAWYRDGTQYVGTTGRTLREVLEEVDNEQKSSQE